ncbi:multidrug resistance-associated ABC transporter [Macrolepiota fuliginosa MF-IS2]|uniref:Multidrug resistance-associated ABC transporter n=1 Tax=Macrolepiota fuliginosa MF-IS2 TaxID=1400762 RepID=A0A9P5XGH6_9AGAR|nr:multidrug resistance-associated ABC transporter [Macrolepiota fuliginosa MF-IS2]
MGGLLRHLVDRIREYLTDHDALWFLSLLPLASALSLLIQSYRRALPTAPKSQNGIEGHDEARGSVKELVKFHGSWAAVAFLVGRAVGCTMLFIIAACLELRDHPGPLAREFIFGMIPYYFYCMVLSFGSVLNTRWQPIFSQHCLLLLFSSLLVNVYRNIWPLAIYGGVPMDINDGIFMWGKLVLLTITAVGIPLFSPRKYEPVNPEEPAAEVNPEQTTPLFSLMVYTFLDPLIFLAARLPHLGHDKLFPLADYDYSRNTTKRAFPHLDVFQGAKKRHLFFGLMRTYRYEYLVLTGMVVLQATGNFFSPVAIRMILDYLETGGRDARIKPWFWIACLFVGPMMISLARQWYIFVATRMLVHTEGLLTQLVFEHSLRIRMKAEASDGSENPTSETKTVKADNLVGKINNLVTTDMVNVVEARDFLFLIGYHPLQIILSIIFLYQVLGSSSFIGLAVILIMVPIPVFMAKLMQSVQKERMKMTDSRVQAVTETCNVLRMIKLFGWESEMHGRIFIRRDEEVKWLWRRKIYEIVVAVVNYLIPTFAMLATYAAYTLIWKEDLSAAKVFSSMSVLTLLRRSLQASFQGLSICVEGKVSLDRLTEFMQNTELLDFLRRPADLSVIGDFENRPPSGVIGFYDAKFVWSNDSANDEQAFTLRIDGELLFKQGGINLIIGPTGSGKTSLLMALLGEMHFLPTQPNSWYNLPREKGIAYAAQESWVQNDTIRGNILFGSSYDEERYKAVLYQCGLERDLELFEAGDMTEVGEKGLSLSGGQKARITLARAVYSNAQTLLLDDILAALDVHTSTWIVERCLTGDLVKGRTVILVTHNIALTGHLANFIISMGSNGTIVSQGTDISVAISKNSKLASEIQALQESEGNTEEANNNKEKAISSNGVSTGKLIIAEEIQQGHVTWKSMKLFLASLGGNHPILFFLALSIGLLLTDFGMMAQTYFVGYWGSQYVEHDPSEINPFFYLGGCFLLLVGLISTYILSNILYLRGVVRACVSIHKQLMVAILGTTFRWLDETPTSRIITRCTQDIRAVDVPLPQWTLFLTDLTLSMLNKVVVIVFFSPIFLVPVVFVSIAGAWIANFYLKAQLSVKREMSNAKAPVLAHFGAAITGLTSIRAYGAQDAFKRESLKRIDFYSRVARVSYNLNRWVAVRIDVLGASFTTTLAAYLVYGSMTTPTGIGFSLSMAVDFCTMILWWVRIFNDLEVQANSLERIQGYLEIEQEPKPKESGSPPAAWPTSGQLRVENLSARYSKNGPKVLHGISFEIQSGERVGVVGRTGSGKSSLMLSLLRCIVVEGDVFYDGINTKNINLEALRSKITIIPQIPELISGTLRRNLDPFEQYDDAILNDSLRASGLFSLQAEDTEKRLTLDSQISSGGSNLSVGQRQILALARAMVRESKLLVLDEATSAIDYKTDTIIQQSLRHELGKDVTIITVAHRLQTIMDADKILVLDAGNIVEYDSPAALLARPSGIFRSMVDGSSDREHLYAMVHRA